ncbi:MAG: phosphate transport system protein [Acidimicrobiaceae bacterium]|jgi:phosphate transport system protein
MRTAFTAELEQLRLQVEVMAIRVDQNLERMREVLERGETALVAIAFAADDEIDAMNVSLTERCYDLLRREAPVASDLRFVVSVLRVLSELERIGDLALRVIKLAPDHELIASNPPSYDILRAMADQVIDRYRDALRAWATLDLSLAAELATPARSMDVFYERLLAELLRLTGTDAARVAITTFAAGRALERIGDHATIIGARLRYLLTGDPDHLAAEVR